MQYLIYGLVIYGLLQIIVYLALFKRFSELALQYPQYKHQTIANLPDYLPQFLQLATQELTDLGFELCTYLRIETTLAGDQCWSVLLYNSAWQTYALANISVEPTPSNPVSIAFETFFDDGILLLTLNGLAHSVIGELPATILQDPYAVNLEQQWQIHQTKFKELILAKTPKFLSTAAFIELLASHEAAYINQLYLDKKIIKQADNNLFTLTIATAWSTALKYKSGIKKQNLILQQKKVIANDKRQTKNNLEIPIEIEIDAYQRLQTSENRRFKNNDQLIKVSILLGSFILFILAAKFYFEWQTILILIGVLFLHELGHLIAMKWCGYEDTAIFFLPFFGAAAAGKKEQATLTEKVLVLLSGPIPGLVLGTILILALPEKLQAIANAKIIITWLIGLNWLNLLPILPLDGGRVINLLLFSRHPYAEMIFKIITVIILAIASMGIGDLMLIVLTILMFLSLPHTFKKAKILQQLSPQWKIKSATSDYLLASIFRAFKIANYDNIPFSSKYRLVKEIVQRYQEPAASWSLRTALIIFYLLCLVGGTLAMELA